MTHSIFVAILATLALFIFGVAVSVQEAEGASPHAAQVHSLPNSTRAHPWERLFLPYNPRADPR